MSFQLPTIESQLPLEVGRARILGLSSHCPECLTPFEQEDMRGFALTDERNLSIVATCECQYCGHEAQLKAWGDSSGRVSVTVDGQLAFHSYGAGLIGKLRTAKAALTCLFLTWIRTGRPYLPFLSRERQLGVSRIAIQRTSSTFLGTFKGYRIADWIETDQGQIFDFDRTAASLQQGIAEREDDEIVLYPGVIYRPRDRENPSGSQDSRRVC